MEVQKPITLNAKAAAKFIGISYWLLLDLVRRKEIPSIKAGNKLLFRLESIERWMTNSEIQSVEKEEVKPLNGIRKIKE